MQGAGTNNLIARVKTRCPFCTGLYSPSLCITITDPKQHNDITWKDGLCLEHHKISTCNSEHHCHHYYCRKHYMSPNNTDSLHVIAQHYTTAEQCHSSLYSVCLTLICWCTLHDLINLEYILQPLYNMTQLISFNLPFYLLVYTL